MGPAVGAAIRWMGGSGTRSPPGSTAQTQVGASLVLVWYSFGTGWYQFGASLVLTGLVGHRIVLRHSKSKLLRGPSSARLPLSSQENCLPLSSQENRSPLSSKKPACKFRRLRSSVASLHVWCQCRLYGPDVCTQSAPSQHPVST